MVALLAASHIATAQKISDYTLHISKTGQEAANLHVACSFEVDFQGTDSISMYFGGGQEYSIDNLKMHGDGCEYTYDYAQKKIVIRRKDDRTVRVGMDYDYTNLSAFFIYGEGDAELWETSFGEYFYPYVPNTYMDVAIEVETPDSLSFLCSYPLAANSATRYSGTLKHILSQSLTLAFLRTDAYQRTEAELPGEVSVYQIKGMQCGRERYDELLELTGASIAFFSKVYGEDYVSAERNVTALPAYVS